MIRRIWIHGLESNTTIPKVFLHHQEHRNVTLKLQNSHTRTKVSRWMIREIEVGGKKGFKPIKFFKWGPNPNK